MLEPKRYVVLIICVLISPSLIWAQFGGGIPSSDQGIIAVVNPSVSGRIITVGGRLIPKRKIDHTIPVDGVVDKILVSRGARISEGTDLIRIVRDEIGETYRPVVLESRLDGIVSEIYIYEKEEVNARTLAITILDDDSFLLRASISDRDAQAVRDLGTIPVEGKTPEGQNFRGKILQVSAEPDYDTGLFTIDMEFPRTGDLNSGKVIFVDLPAEEAKGIMVHETAVFILGDDFYMWIVNDKNQISQRKIIPGEKIESNVIIEQGIAPGERYIRRVSGKEQDGMNLRDLMNVLRGSGSNQGGG